nr:carboxypeptidase-like regulatory domain-containing protein [Pseudobdellovibrionaceae bacterium]
MRQYSIFKIIGLNLNLNLNFRLSVCLGLSFFILSCSPYVEQAQKQAPRKEVPTKPTPPQNQDFEAPIEYVWTYKSSLGEANGVELQQCPADFHIDKTCLKKLEVCQRGISVYSCLPQNLEVRIYGTVTDESGLPVRGAQIFSLMSLPIGKEQWMAETKENGQFVVK